MSFQPHRCGQS